VATREGFQMNDAVEKLIEEAVVSIVPGLIASIKDKLAASSVDLVAVKSDVDRPLADYEEGIVPDPPK